jgi:hypothetical protein
MNGDPASAAAVKFGVLAAEVRKVEQRFRLGHNQYLTKSIAALLQERYEFCRGLPSNRKPLPCRDGLPLPRVEKKSRN